MNARRTQARLLGVFEATHKLRRAGRIEQTVLAINRSDYMLDEPSSTLMQARDLLAHHEASGCANF